MKKSIQLVVAGAGLAGKQHIAAIEQTSGVGLTAIVDPASDAMEYANRLEVPYYPSLPDMFMGQAPDGVIVAMPNEMHVEAGLACIAERCPVLIEKPVATSVADAKTLVEEAKIADVPVLAGHHRRFNPLIQAARNLIEKGEMGQLQAVQGSCWLYKPDSYFELAPWRKEKGAGPINVNLIHDIDLIRYLCGEIINVQAAIRSSNRGYHNEEVAAVIMRFENGAIGTLTVSDSIVAPWSWELTAWENPKYPRTNQSCYMLGGSHGSLSLPDLTLWKNPGERGWWQPVSATNQPYEAANPLAKQIEHFALVIQGQIRPMISGQEGLKTLQVTEAIHMSATNGMAIAL